MRPDEFWALTPSEFYVIYEGFRRKQRRDLNQTTCGAWLTARYLGAKGLPEIKDILIDEDEPQDEPKKMTGEQIMAKCRLINAMLGGSEVVV